MGTHLISRLTMKTLVTLMLTLMLTVSAIHIIPHAYPHFHQCDPEWASDPMGPLSECSACGCTPAAVCQQGCAMSCVSMALAGRGFSLPPTFGSLPITPGSMNTWLRSGSPPGYVCAGGDCNNLVLARPNELSTPSVGKISFVSEAEKPAYTVLKQWIRDERVVIAHVRDRTHFVLLVGWDTANPTPAFLVNDPGFNSTSYTYDDIADVILYDITSA